MTDPPYLAFRSTAASPYPGALLDDETCRSLAAVLAEAFRRWEASWDERLEHQRRKNL